VTTDIQDREGILPSIKSFLGKGRCGQERVEDFIDVVLSLDNLIDPYSPYIDRGSDARAQARADEQARDEVHKIAAKDYMDRYINPPEFLEAGAKERMQKEQQRRGASRRSRRATC
jgi:stage V sporulation protein R